MKKNINIKLIIVLNLLFCFYSFGGVCSKLASGYDFLSWGYILFYGLEILPLMIYAVVWQQILKVTPLNLAYPNKAVTVIWSIVWGVLFFGEKLTPGKLIGAVLIITGIILISLRPNDTEKE